MTTKVTSSSLKILCYTSWTPNRPTDPFSQNYSTMSTFRPFSNRQLVRLKPVRLKKINTFSLGN